jgi:general secretion pathway protein D
VARSARRGHHDPPQPQRRRAGDNLGVARGQVRVIGDKPTNSLIVMSSGRDFLAIKDVVRLDHARKQVFIEAVILEVQLPRSSTSARSSHGNLPVGRLERAGARRGQTANLPRSARGVARGGATGLIGGLIGRRWPTRRPSSHQHPVVRDAVQALATQNNTDILSAPTSSRSTTRRPSSRSATTSA